MEINHTNSGLKYSNQLKIDIHHFLPILFIIVTFNIFYHKIQSLFNCNW